jgi:hypothetical protein
MSYYFSPGEENWSPWRVDCLPSEGSQSAFCQYDGIISVIGYEFLDHFGWINTILIETLLD